MTVNISKPAVNVREKLAELDKPTGIAGEAMLRAETPQEQFNLIGAGRKNIFINGGFTIAQRSAGPVTASGYTTVDRWLFPNSGITSQQVTNDRVSYPDKMLKVTSASSGYGIIRQTVENAATLSGQTVTLSFWAKTSDARDFRVEFQQIFGSGGSPTVTPFNDNAYWQVPNDGWNFYSITVDLPSTLGKTHGSGSGLSVLFGPNSGTANSVVYYSEVQLELGKVATPFEHRSYGEELALCQRYYFNADNAAGNFLGRGLMGSHWTTSYLGVNVPYPVPMRVNPTVSTTAGGPHLIYNVAFVAGGVTANYNSVEHINHKNANLNFYQMSSGYATGTPVSVSEIKVQFDAEL